MLSRHSADLSIGKLALEVVFLVAAVFFALAVDEAWESHENEEAAERALSRISMELDKNRGLIRRESEYHKIELEKLQPGIEILDSGHPLPEDFEFNPSLNISILRDTAWRSAQVADVLKFLPYERIETLTAVYSLQELYRAQSAKAFNYLGDVEFLGAEPGIQLRSTFQTILKMNSIEQVLLQAYADAEVQLEPVVAEAKKPRQ